MTVETSRRLYWFVGVALVLGAISFIASPLRLPDSSFYTNAEAQGVVPGCAEIHCFRVLVPWTLGALPGPSTFKWKAYAVLCDTAAALAVFDLCLVFGHTRRAAFIALALSAFGFGALLTMFEPYTSDPLMFWWSPLVLRWELEGRRWWPAAVACVSVLAKEFLVVALAVFAMASAHARQWVATRQAVATAAAACAVWLALQLWLRVRFGYSFGPNRSPRLAAGSYLFFWLSQMSPRGALSAMYNEFGAVYLLAPIGWFSAPRTLKRLTLAAVPVACALAVVQQPDRALWNFHFLATPIAALVLADLPNVLLGAFFAFYVAANMKVGAQVGFMPQARYALAASAVLAIVAIALHRRRASEGVIQEVL
jgi:hypothetical protein